MNLGESESAGRIRGGQNANRAVGPSVSHWTAISYAILTKPEAGMVFVFTFGDIQLRPLVVAAVVLVGVVEAA